MKNLISQDGCWNCKFHITERTIRSFSEWPYWYCNFNSDCPVKYIDWEFNDENGFDLIKYDDKGQTVSGDELQSNRMHDLYLWQRDHEVKSYQKCDSWQKCKPN